MTLCREEDYPRCMFYALVALLSGVQASGMIVIFIRLATIDEFMCHSVLSQLELINSSCGFWGRVGACDEQVTVRIDSCLSRSISFD
jgi:hypothetical protein